MSKLGINTGTTPNDGTGDSLLDGAVKINTNFNELYSLLGDGNTLSVGVVTAITAGSGIDVSSASGNVTVTNTASGITTENVVTNSLVVAGVTTAGIVTGATYYGDGSNLSGITGFWESNDTGITTITNIGIGTTTASSALTVDGDANFTGIVTASSFSGAITGIATISSGRIQADATSNLRFGNVASGSGSSRNIAIGDQVLGSLSSGNGRNIGIGELSFNNTLSGSYNIGVGVKAGEKITSGDYNVVLGGYDGNSGNLDIKTSSNNVVLSDGEGNIRQFINSSGDVGIKTTIITEALTVAGVVSATSFYGTVPASQLTGALPSLDGSALTGVTAIGSGVEIRDSDSPVGAAATINFGNNLSVVLSTGIATVSGASSVSTATTAYGLSGSPDINVGVVTATRFVGSGISLTGITAYQVGALVGVASDTNPQLGGNLDVDGNNIIGIGSISLTGIITATQFVGGGASLTSLPAGQLTGTLPAIDGSNLLNVTASGTGIVVEDDKVNVGSAVTVDFGTGLDVAFNAGVATVTASGGSLQSRTGVSTSTGSIADNAVGLVSVTGFKSYALMRVGLSTAGWIRIYTDSASRTADSSRSVGIDPAPGSGVIAEVVTTGISTQQNISPFTMGGNMDNPVDNTIYASITNLSGTTQAITANLTILQLEA